ncbi:MAG: HAD family hydrolase [Treponema sp.]
MNCDGIILDIDGTIWDTTFIVADAWNRAIEKSFPSVPHVNAGLLKTQFGKPMNVIADSLFVGLDEVQKEKLMKLCCIEEEKAILENQKNITYDGATETIKKLSQKYPVFIVSNCHDGYIQLVMKKNGLEKYITDFECFGHTGKQKGENIALVVKRNKLLNPVYVGDTQGDFDECQKAGVNFVWAKYGFGTLDSESQKKSSGIINSFSEIAKLLHL